MSTPSAIGPYQVVREIGRGGMGVVLEVRHPQVARRLALKSILPGAFDGEAVARFEREAKLLARVSHPNVVTVHALDSDRGRHYLVTDLVEGRNLKEVAREAPVAPERAARIVAALASGVSAIHEKEILHRDLKPENVILRADDSPVLLDFGLAREVDARSLTQSGTLVGTPAYMAPEQASGEGSRSLDARVDVYGLGAILFELLAGRPPFEGPGPVQVIAAVLMKEPRWPSATRRDIPPELEAILRRTLAKSRELRPPTARALADELDAFLRGERKAPSSSRPGRWLVAGVVGLSLAAVAGVVTLTQKSAPPIPVATPTPAKASPTPTPEPTPPPPPSGAVKTPSEFRDLLAWLRREDTRSHPVRSEAKNRLKDARGQFLVRVPAPDGDPLTVRFLTDQWLAVLTSARLLKVLDLDHPSKLLDLLELPSRSNAKDYRPLDLAVLTPPEGRQTIFVASQRGLFKAPFDPVKGPDPTSALTPVWGTDAPGKSGQTVNAVAIAPDGETIAVGTSSLVVLYRESQERGRVALADCNMVKSLHFVAEGKRLLVGYSTPERPSCVALVDPTSATELAHEPFALHGLAPARSRSGGDVVAFASGAGLRLLLAPNGLGVDQLGSFELSPWRVDDVTPTFVGLAFGGSPEALLYAVTVPTTERESLLTVWKPGEPKEPFRYFPRSKGSPHSIAVSPSGTFIAVGGWSEIKMSVEVWGAGD